MSAENQFERLIRSITDYAIFMLDTDGIVISWNSGAERIKRYSADAIVGQHFSRFYTAEDRLAQVPARALAAAKTEGRYEAEGLRVRADGSLFWASVVIDAVHDEQGELIGFAKITRDITERKEAEQRLADTREQLFQAQKLEAVGQLAGGFAHDFNNLLTTITAGAELAQRLASTDDRIHEILGTILDASRRGTHLTRQLLSFARQQSLEAELVELDDFLETLLGLLRPALRSTIELSITITGKPALITDATQLEMALLNLTFNARDAMPDGGRLVISASEVELSGEPAGLTGQFIAISVEDNGCGVAPELQQRILEPFFTTKEFGGTGLGLSQAYGFATQAGGTLTIASAPDAGFLATIYLPTGSLATGINRATPEGEREPRAGRDGASEQG